MTSRKLSNVFRGGMLIFCALALSLSASSAGWANSKINTPARVTTVKRNPSEVKRTLLQIVDRKGKLNPKLAKALSAACNCCAAAFQEGGFSFRSCFKNCLTSNGVSMMTAGACAGGCFTNPYGCIVCAGIAEYILLGCIQYCAWYRVFNIMKLPRVFHQHVFHQLVVYPKCCLN